MADPTPTASPPRPSVVQLAIKEKGALFSAYIPALLNGGIFVPTTRSYRLGDDVYLLLSLPEESQRYPIAGKVAWVNPPHAGGDRKQGVGIHFPADEKSVELRNKIEVILGKHLSADRATQTI